MNYTLLPGKPYPLGARASSSGTNFALYSEHATRVQLCLFDDTGRQTECIDLRERTAFVWHGLLRGVRPGVVPGSTPVANRKNPLAARCTWSSSGGSGPSKGSSVQIAVSSAASHDKQGLKSGYIFTP